MQSLPHIFDMSYDAEGLFEPLERKTKFEIVSAGKTLTIQKITFAYKYADKQL